MDRCFRGLHHFLIFHWGAFLMGVCPQLVAYFAWESWVERKGTRKRAPLVFSVRPWFRENLATLSAHLSTHEFAYISDRNGLRMDMYQGCFPEPTKLRKDRSIEKPGWTSCALLYLPKLAYTIAYHSIHLWNSSWCQWPQKVGTVLSHQNLNDDSDGCNRVIRLSVFPSLDVGTSQWFYITCVCLMLAKDIFVLEHQLIKGNPYEPTAIQITTNDTLAKLCRLALLFDGFCWPVISWRWLDVVVSGMVLWGMRFGFVEFADAEKSMPCRGHALEEMQ